MKTVTITVEFTMDVPEKTDSSNITMEFGAIEVYDGSNEKVDHKLLGHQTTNVEVN